MSPKQILDAAFEAHQKRSWSEDFSHENGNYTCLCAVCEMTFTGHKRRVICKDCYSTTESKGDKS